MKRFCLPRTPSTFLTVKRSLAALLFSAVALSALTATAQTRVLAKPETRITAKVDNKQTTTLTGNTHPLASRANDRGLADLDTPMTRMVLSLSHSDAQESALNTLIAQQQDKRSPNFHQWLTPQQYGAQFGVADADIKTVTDWLSGQGFTVTEVGAGRNTIEFSGTAAQIKTAFQTEIHKFSVEGKLYQANASDPSIPTALVPVVRGVIQMHNFPHGSNAVSAGRFRRDKISGALTKLSGPPTVDDLTSPPAGNKSPVPVSDAHPEFTYTSGTSTEHAIVPYDFATIYNVLPLWNAGIDGTGQTIAIVQETNIHLDDVRAFRSLFGLPPNDPQVILNGPDPGVTSGDEGEADIDVQWSGAVAKGATIKLVASASTEATYGVALSALYIVNNNVAPVVSYSYGECELATGTSLNSFYNTLYQQAASQGISFFVSTGDSGSTVCNRAGSSAKAYPVTLGLSVNGWGSTPYNTAVGGTDFMGSSSRFNSAYWSATNNPTTQASALAYIPETTWNDNCTNPYLRDISYPGTYSNSAAICQAFYSNAIGNSSYNYQYLQDNGGSGGVSNCTSSSGASTVAGVATCTGGWPKPSYQTGVLGVPADGKRDVPDVSLMAGNGFFGSFYVVCQEDVNTDGKSCNTASPYADFGGYGGTSVATPAFAGIMAMINQKTNSRQGNANYVLYDLFNQQMAAGTSCSVGLNASAQTLITPASGCVFNDLTYGNNSAVCTVNDPNCTTTGSNKYGIIQSGGGDAWTNTTGYDLASGLGSVNATNLVNSWNNITFVPTSTTLAMSSTTFAHGTSVNATIGVAPTSGGGGTPTGTVTLITSTPANSQLLPATLSNGSVVAPYANLPGGSYTVSAYYTGDGTYAASTSSPVSLTVTPENSTLTSTFSSVNESSGALTAITSPTSFAYGSTFYLMMQTAAVSGKGTPSGQVVLKDGNSTFGTYALSTNGEAELQYFFIPTVGTHNFTETYSGDASFNSSSSSTAAITITQAPVKNTLTRGSTSIAAGAPVTLTSAVVSNNASAIGNFAYPPSGTVTFYTGTTSGALTTVIGTAPLNPGTGVVGNNVITSTAKITTANLPSGTDYITAVYPGDSNFTALNSASGTITVAAATKTATTASMTASSNPVSYGASPTFTVSVSTSSSTLVPSGTVTFYVDGVVSGSAITLSGGAVGTPGTASLQISGLLGGTHAITSIYSGDTNFLGSSGAVQQTVSPVAVTLGLTDSVSTAIQGTSIVFAATVPYTTTATPTGTITFSVDGASNPGIAISALAAGGLGSYFTAGATLAPGTHTVSATYSGDKNYASSGSSLTITLTAAPLLTLSTNQRSVIVLGAPVTIGVLAQTVTSGPIPTGTVSYSVDGGAVTSGLTLTNGATSFALSGLNILKHVVTVTYSGDSTYTSVSQTLALNSDIPQFILFPGLSPATLAITPTVTLAARATSGLPVTYTVTGPATLSGSTLTLTGTGTVSVTASVAANSSFAAATSVTRSFIVQ